MTAHVPRLLVALVTALIVSLSSATAAHATPPPPTPSPPAASEETSTSYADNPFLPEDRSLNLSDCVSAVPKPGCGSKARGGTGQTLVFVALAAGLGVIGWRIVVGLRKQQA